MADISYTPTTWADGAEGGTPVNSTRLNNIEQGIVDAVAAIGPNDTTADGTLKAQIDALGNIVSSIESGQEIITAGNNNEGTASITFQEEHTNGVKVFLFLLTNDPANKRVAANNVTKNGFTITLQAPKDWVGFVNWLAIG